MKIRRALVAISLTAVALAGCSDSTPQATSAETVVESAVTDSAATPGVRLVTVDDAERLAADPAVTVIDIRTPEEFASGHLDRSAEIDFYSPTFNSQLEQLDRNGRYLIYCRSGNRSGKARALMTDLGFTDVADMDGGVLAWTAAGKSLAP